MEYLEISR